MRHRRATARHRRRPPFRRPGRRPGATARRQRHQPIQESGPCRRFGTAPLGQVAQSAQDPGQVHGRPTAVVKKFIRILSRHAPWRSSFECRRGWETEGQTTGPGPAPTPRPPPAVRFVAARLVSGLGRWGALPDPALPEACASVVLPDLPNPYRCGGSAGLSPASQFSPSRGHPTRSDYRIRTAPHRESALPRQKTDRPPAAGVRTGCRRWP